MEYVGCCGSCRILGINSSIGNYLGPYSINYGLKVQDSGYIWVCLVLEVTIHPNTLGFSLAVVSATLVLLLVQVSFHTANEK